MHGDLVGARAGDARHVDVDLLDLAHARDCQQRDRKERRDGAYRELGVNVDSQEQNENGKNYDLGNHGCVENQRLDDFQPTAPAAPKNSQRDAGKRRERECAADFIEAGFEVRQQQRRSDVPPERMQDIEHGREQFSKEDARAADKLPNGHDQQQRQHLYAKRGLQLRREKNAVWPCVIHCSSFP